MVKVAAPLVSIVMAVRNGRHYLEQAVGSMLQQSYSKFEFIVVNDGSTDRSGETLDRLARLDARIRVVHQPQLGLVHSLNLGVRLSRGSLIARMDADDIAVAERLEMQVDHLNAHPACVGVGGALLLIDADDRPIGVQAWATEPSVIQAQLNHGCGGIAHPAALLRTSAVRKVGAYRSEYQWVEDLDLWLRLSECGELHNLSNVVLAYRMHARSVCSNRQQLQRRLREQLMYEYAARQGMKFDPHACSVDLRAKMTAGRVACRAARAGYLNSACHYLCRGFVTSLWHPTTWLAPVVVGWEWLRGLIHPRRLPSVPTVDLPKDRQPPIADTAA